MIKVFVATKATQGQRANDFSFTNDDELLMVGHECDSDHGDPDGSCGCMRSLSGLDTFKGTTTFEVVERDMNFDALKQAIIASWTRAGFGGFGSLTMPAMQTALYIIAEAQRFPVGTICERRGAFIVARQLPAAAPIETDWKAEFINAMME